MGIQSIQSLNVYKIDQVPSSSSTLPYMSHCLTVSGNGSWKLYIHGKNVDADVCARLLSDAPINQPTCLAAMVQKVDSLNICIGNPESNFVEICESHKGDKICSPDGSVAAFKDQCVLMHEGEQINHTVRSSKCDLIVGGSRCDSCRKYRSVLRAMSSRQKRSPPSAERTGISSHANYRYLTTPEKTTRLSNLRHEVSQQKRKVEVLEEKVKQLHKSCGVEVDEEMHNDLSGIMDEMNEEVNKKYPENLFHRIFWKQQLQAKQLRDKRQIRWHPAMIKWCLNLKLMSSSSYHAMRSSGVLVLPSERTLRDYTHWMSSDVGFSESVDQDLMKEAKLDAAQDFQKHVCLVFDEVRIKEDLVYDNHTCQIIGFVNLGEITNQQLELEHSESGKPQQRVAKNMLVFMVRSLFSTLEYPYAQFLCSSLSADLIFPLLWDCIKRLESCGFKVVALTAENSSRCMELVVLLCTKPRTHSVLKEGRYTSSLMFCT